MSAVTDGKKPRLECEIVFRGIHGRLELDLTAKNKVQAGRVVPMFYSLSGEDCAIADKLLGLVRAATRGVNCRGSSHVHYLRKPRSLSLPKLNNSIAPEISDGEILETLVS